ncbi:hypothetical protein PACTADRAFT_3074 [Pachysolen tannophilus NRRL Y-2460]|uniref:Uncharacterized protein n=1 Tax=Pachysolen tannophilus NRRL Y-2460 TaxID=669874 RepID=A0A1E4TUC9_PACTA|nr:hypothetical protein PACTADRAFT_3074 [Pachysolen tannophilus NRRL Y-2460]
MSSKVRARCQHYDMPGPILTLLFKNDCTCLSWLILIIKAITLMMYLQLIMPSAYALALVFSSHIVTAAKI